MKVILRKFQLLSHQVRGNVTFSGRTNSNLNCTKICCTARHLTTKPTSTGPPVVIGGSNVDIVITSKEQLKFDGRFLQGTLSPFCGGVARNIADALARLQVDPLFITAIGDDEYGNLILNGLKHIKNKGIIICKDKATACLSVVVDTDKECKLLIGNLDIHSKISKDWIQKFEIDIVRSSFVILDGNLNLDSLDFILSICNANNIPVWFEPTDISYCNVIFKSKQWKTVTHISPNFLELKIMTSALTGKDYSDINPKNLDELLQVSIELAKKIPIKFIMVTLGKHGMVIVTEDSIKYFEALVIDHIENVSGAGDCSVAGYIAAHLKNFNENKKIAAALSCARQALTTSKPVPSKIDLETPEVCSREIKPITFLPWV